MKVRGINKKVLVTIITLMCVILFSAMSVFIVNLISEDRTVNNAEEYFTVFTEQDVNYTFSATGLYIDSGLSNAPTKDQYNSWTTFGIENAFGLIAFSHSVANGYNFEGKTVYLLGDIQGEYISNYVPIGAKMWDGINSTTKYNGKSAFKGTFDGQNYTVSNLNCNVESRDDDSGDLHLGFFAQLQAPAIVQNLRINNFTISNYSNKVNTLIGGIVGYGNLYDSNGTVTIKNCLVKNLTANVKDEATVAGGLVGYSKIGDTDNIIFENCAVDKFDVNASVKCDSAGGLIAKTYVCRSSIDGGISYFYGRVNISNCHIKDFSVTGSSASYIANLSPARGIIYSATTYTNPNNWPLIVTYDDTYFSFSITYCVVQVNNTYSNVKDSGNIVNCISDNIITTATDEGLDCNNLGGAGESTIWYRATGYNNNGYPKLRQFIPWKTIYFNAGAGVNVSLTSAEVPSDQELSYNINDETATVTFFGRTSVADNIGCCYSFTGWSFDGDCTFTANSQRNASKIYFKYDSNIILQTVWQDGSIGGDHGGDISHDYYCGETLYISFVAYRVGIYSQVWLGFNGVSVVYTWKSTSPYYISGIKVNGSLVTSNVEIHGTPTVEIVLSLKEYKPSFQ